MRIHGDLFPGVGALGAVGTSVLMRAVTEMLSGRAQHFVDQDLWFESYALTQFLPFLFYH